MSTYFIPCEEISRSKLLMGIVIKYSFYLLLNLIKINFNLKILYN